ncbi:glycosyltransferase [Alteromonas aestuariivivens]|uniref:Glycosyltransferase n=1 Tax=Alteromonas aestuariivivens TaxID=1938339 RepID=A0A3D8M5M7_9ALTE|nr:glycosyltransferase family 2 protein [Alteromonas aestuariivivens]RDV25053.1 glycosyltransferase [Alteromonas aestuariivivens]
MTKVSVWMPAHNAGPFLSEAIESVLVQTHPELELLIWNDGSVDETDSIAQQWATRDTRVKVFSSGNKGIVRSLNALLPHTHGEYVMRMDSDDVCFPDRIAKQLAYFSSDRSLGVLGCKVSLIGNHSGVWHYRQTAKQTEALAMLGNTPLCHPSWMVKRELYEQFHYDPSYQDMEDYEWLARVLFNSPFRGYAAREVLMHYRVHADNISVKRKTNQIRLRKRVLSSIWENLGINFDNHDVNRFCDELLTGVPCQDMTGITESVEKILPQLGEINAHTTNEIRRRFNRCMQKQ